MQSKPSANLPDLLQKFTQEDMAASGLRVALALTGPLGVIAAESLTQFVPQQRLDRLQEFIQQLSERLAGFEEQFNERLRSSRGYAALTEEATLSAVRTPSSEQWRDLAALLQHGLSRSDAEMLEESALLELRQQLNDAQVLILMRHGSFRGTLGDPELKSFLQGHPGVFGIARPSLAASPGERRRWAMYPHYERGLAALGLLEDTEGVAKSGHQRQFRITPSGTFCSRPSVVLHSGNDATSQPSARAVSLPTAELVPSLSLLFWRRQLVWLRIPPHERAH